MKPPKPTLVVHLFPDLLGGLLDVLNQLSRGEWKLPTACAGWSVKDVALHLLGGDIGILSGKRDRHSWIDQDPKDWAELVDLVNRENAAWLKGSQRISTRLLVDLLGLTGREVADYFETLDPYKMGSPVSWAGPEPAPIWLDLAREYTERWHHQQHIREAVGRPGLDGPRFLGPVLETFAWALPRTYRDVAVPNGMRVGLTISGDSGGRWVLRQEDQGWVLYEDDGEDSDGEMVLPAKTAWQLFTRGMDRQAAEGQAHCTGDRQLAAHIFDTVAIIA